MTARAAVPDAALCSMQSLKIDIVVHGRFHAFHLARALLARRHDVRLLTNYPKWAVRRFAIPNGCVRSFALHGIASRMQSGTIGKFAAGVGQPMLHRAFGSWAARTVRRDADLIYVLSSVAEEILRCVRGRQHVWVARGSSHIRTQHLLLEQEEARAGTHIDKPDPWFIDREEREYELAERIVTLSSFSHSTFMNRPSLADKTILLLSAVDVGRFRPEQKDLDARIRRIEAGEPLRVLTVGSFSYRKGAQDLVDAAAALRGRMQFRFVGDTPAETRKLQAKARALIDMRPRVAEADLPEHYRWADLFVFPTVEDGFPAVVAQAQASGLVVITTPNGSGPDLIAPAETGWIVPIRSPASIVERLTFCDEHRDTLAQMTKASIGSVKQRDWSAMAEDLESHYAALGSQ